MRAGILAGQMVGAFVGGLVFVPLLASGAVCGTGLTIVSETVLALRYALLGGGRRPSLWQLLAAPVFAGVILAPIKAHE